MSEKTVPQNDLAKALTALQEIAKGHNSRGTATTEVESMRDSGVGAGSDAGSTQVYHTPSNSDPGGWAGSRGRDCPEDGATDSVGSDGTDYVAQGKMMKSIIEKMAKGIALSPEEAVAYAEIAKGGNPFADMKDKDDDKKDKKDVEKAGYSKEEEEKMGKSLEDHAQEDETVAKGLEVSEFLAGFANVMHKSLQSLEARLESRVLGALASEAEGTGEFNKSLAEAVVRLGEAVTAVTQRVDQVETQPAHAPRSVQNVQVLEKSGYEGPEGEALNKAWVAATLIDLVQKGEVTTQDVLKYDSNGTMTKRVEHKVRTALGSGR
jgi:hypothetical protein